MGLFNKKRTEWNLQVPGMNCPHCEAKVQDALKGIPGVSEVKADAESKRVSLRIDGKTPPAESAVHEALESAGYPVAAQ